MRGAGANLRRLALTPLTRVCATARPARSIPLPQGERSKVVRSMVFLRGKTGIAPAMPDEGCGREPAEACANTPHPCLRDGAAGALDPSPTRGEEQGCALDGLPAGEDRHRASDAR